MLFNSIEFAIFLPIVFLLYWFVFKSNLRLQNFFIVIASYVFYGWWDWRFLLLISFTTLCSWGSGILIEKTRKGQTASSERRAKLISGLNIILNLGILGFFKYYGFFIQAFTDAFLLFGKPLNIYSLQIILPVGISFYTFQALSYSIDVYKRKIEPTRDIVAFFAFVSFFPQLVAGPIERATNLLPQFYKKRLFEYDKAADGMRQILWGLFKKIVVADNCAILVDSIYTQQESQGGIILFIGMIAFAFQIYCDFSGYSDIAIGTARLFGINLMQNFNYPYFSRDIAEFWRRWHISLTTWFRDYVYIPLGGSRGSKAMIIRNTFIIFLLSGFWHGANWTFIIWGAYHAILFMPLILLGKNRKYLNTVAAGKVLPSLKDFIQIVFTFFLVVIGWIFFRSESVVEAFKYIDGVFFSPASFLDLSSFSLIRFKVSGYTMIFIFMSVCLLLFVEWIQRSRIHGLEIHGMKKPVRWTIYILLSLFIYLTHANPAQFIYFQF